MDEEKHQQNQLNDVNEDSEHFDTLEGATHVPRQTMGQKLFSGNEKSVDEESKHEPPFKVTVSDPEKKGEGMSQYMSYKVNTDYVASNGQPARSSVLRRFSDFVWLYEKLYVSFKGILIPPLPEKGILTRFTGSFIDERMRGLKQFLNRIAAHHGLAQSEEVNLFLHGNDSELSDARDGNGLTFDSTSFVTFFTESVRTITNTFKNKEREKTEDDLACEKIVQGIGELDTALISVHEKTSDILKKEKALSKSLSQFGAASELLGKYESNQDEENFGTMFTQVGSSANQIADLLMKKSEAGKSVFQTPIKDSIRIVGSVKAMMKTRSAAQVTFLKSLANIEDKQTKLNTVQGIAGKENKALALEKSLIEAQTTVDQDQEELQKITASCLSEVERFKTSKRRDMRKFILDFCKIQINFAKKEQEIWESIIPSIEILPSVSDDT